MQSYKGYTLFFVIMSILCLVSGILFIKRVGMSSLSQNTTEYIGITNFVCSLLSCIIIIGIIIHAYTRYEDSFFSDS